MEKNKLIIFDWGGVVESHSNIGYSFWESTVDVFNSFNVNMDDSEIMANYIECCHNLENQSDKYELFDKLKTVFNLECTIEEFTERYNKYMLKTDFYKDVVEYIHSLKERCYIGILSNQNPFDKVRIDYQMDLSKFDYVWLSFELNCRKPNSRIYDIVESEISITSENILFIDDLSKNLEIPKTKGWNICQATGDQLDKIKSSVEEFLKK